MEAVAPGSVAAARAALERGAFDVVLLDQRPPDGDGPEVAPLALRPNDAVKLPLLTAFPSYNRAAQALRSGIRDCLSRPVGIAEARRAVATLLRATELERIPKVRRRATSQDEARALATSSVLFGGRRTRPPTFSSRAKPGRAKRWSPRRFATARPRPASVHGRQSCAALPETLVEAGLFGVEKGAYAGAVQRRVLIERAKGSRFFSMRLPKCRRPRRRSCSARSKTGRRASPGWRARPAHRDAAHRARRRRPPTRGRGPAARMPTARRARSRRLRGSGSWLSMSNSAAI